MKYLLFVVIAIVMFDWGHTVGGYGGYETQASYGRFKCDTEECSNYQQPALHLFVPFPDNLLDALKHFNIYDL